MTPTESCAPYIGTESGKVLVCGTGHSLWQDMLNAGYTPNKYQQNFDILCVNRSIMDIPSDIKHMYSNHTRAIPHWVNGRDETHQKKDKHSVTRIITHTNSDNGNRHIHWPWTGHGTSSLMAVWTAITLGYDDIYVCGVPMDDAPHYYDPPWLQPNFDNSHNFRHWKNSRDRVFQDKVKVMSGRLKEEAGL